MRLLVLLLQLRDRRLQATGHLIATNDWFRVVGFLGMVDRGRAEQARLFALLGMGQDN